MSLRTPLGRVLGYGSAKEGTDHWWLQRTTAVALVFLGLWCLLSLAAVASFDHATVIAWMARPLNSVALLLFSLVLAYHSSLGIQVVIEDYVHGPFVKVAALVLNKFAHVAAAAAASLALLKIVFGAS